MRKDLMPAISSDDPGLGSRLIALKKIHTPFLCNEIKDAIRNECLGSWIDKAISVWGTGAYDSAYLYFWNRAMADLRTKILAYGKEHLESILSKTINDEQHLIQLLDDNGLINHCFELGIISEEAWFFLHKARETRNHYSAAHQFNCEIDRIEAINIIKNCIKYVLAHQVPSPGVNLKDIIETIKKEDVSHRIAEFEAIYTDQSVKITNVTLNRLFDDFVGEKPNKIYGNNILLLSPILWRLSEISVKERIGRAIAKIRVERDETTNRLAMIFIKRVNGVKYIPDSVRVAIFSGTAEKLSAACESFNNFHLEPAEAKELHDLGFDVPSSAIKQCTIATLLSFIGNRYGYSNSADWYNREMIQNWNSQNISALAELLKDNLTIISRLDGEQPATRLKELLTIIQPIPAETGDEREIGKLKAMSVAALTAHFERIYTLRFKLKTSQKSA